MALAGAPSGSFFRLEWDPIGHGSPGVLLTRAQQPETTGAPPSPQADIELARAVARGDRVAAERFARRLTPIARKVASVGLGRGAAADDAAQDVLLEILGSAANFRGEGALEGWAYRIAWRVVARGRKRGRWIDRRLRLVAEPDERNDASLPRRPADAIPRALGDYMAELRGSYREVFVLRHVFEHTLPEIAAMTGSPVPTVKSRLGKALEELRRSVRRDIALGRAKGGSS